MIKKRIFLLKHLIKRLAKHIKVPAILQLIIILSKIKILDIKLIKNTNKPKTTLEIITKIPNKLPINPMAKRE